MSSFLPLILGFESTQVTEQLREKLLFCQPAGIILFRRNCRTAEQTRALTDSLRELLGADLLIAIDEEGGRVSRLDDFCTPTPAAAALSASQDPALVSQAARITARRLSLLGIDLNLAPVADLNLRPDMQNALGGRCWGSSAAAVINNIGPWIEAFRKEHILSCIKHFPGTGRAECDPHFSLPRVEASAQQLEEDLAPYLALCDRSPTVMIGHLSYAAYEQEGTRPACQEPGIVRQLLRDRLGYEGVILCDDLEMEAIMSHQSIEQATATTLQAGVDLALICHNIERGSAAAQHLKEHCMQSPWMQDTLVRVEKLRHQARKTRFFDWDQWQQLEQQVVELERATAKYQNLAPKENSPVADY